MAAITLDMIPKDLLAHIREGGDVRVDETAPYAGRCGGVVKRNNGAKDGGVFCQRGAGWNTDHKGFGRCCHHDDQPYDDTEALPPWAGELEADTWAAINGKAGRQPNSVARTHGAYEVLRLSWNDYIRETLDPDERHAFDSMPTDPVLIIDQEIKLARLGAARIHRWLRTQRMIAEHDRTTVGGQRRDLDIIQAEQQIVRITTVVARLMEVRARYSEIASGRATDDVLEDALRALSDTDFLKASSDPRVLLSLAARTEPIHS